MSYPQPVTVPIEEPRTGLRWRIIGIVVFLVIILITAILIIYGYVINTTFDYALQSNPIYASLPAAAKTAFGSAVSWQLNTYDFIPAVIILMAIAGTVAAVFGLQSAPEDSETF